MANTKTTSAKTTSTKTTETTTKKDETKELKAQLKAQQEQIEELMKMIAMQASSQNNNVSDDIASDEEVLVVSLVGNKLNLLGRDGSVLVSFDEMYEEQYIDYAILKEIVTANRQMAKGGRFYIMDERIVNKLRLKNDYKNILSPDQLKDLLNKNVDSAIELYKIAPSRQKGVIVDLIKEKKFSDPNMDMNFLHKFSKLSGCDLVNVEDATKIEVK